MQRYAGAGNSNSSGFSGGPSSAGSRDSSRLDVSPYAPPNYPLNPRRQQQLAPYRLKCDREPLNNKLGPPDFYPQTPNCPEETLTKEYVQSGYKETVEGIEEAREIVLSHISYFCKPDIVGKCKEPMERWQQRRKCKNAGGTEAPATTTSIHDFPDDMLRMILLCLHSPLCLVRAAYTCRRWRGIVAADGGAVLRLARSLHPPFVVGHYHHRGSGPITFVPSSPPAPIDCRRFSLDFLPLGASSWDVVDCHGGLVLLLERGCPLPKLLVCDPLTRRHRGMRYRPPAEHAGCDVADAFLLDPCNGGSISMSNFTVVYRLNKDSGPGDCVFATSSGSHGVRFVCASANDLDVDCRGQVAGRVNGCLYLGLATGSVIVLDKATLDFSQVDLPSRVDPSKKNYHASYRVVHGAGPDLYSPPTARIVHANGEELEVFRRVHGTTVWVLEHSVPRLSEVARGLPSYLAERPFHWAVKVIADGVGFAVLSVLDLSKRKWLFTIDVDTMEVQFMPESTYHLYRGTRATSTYTLPKFMIKLA